jgi:hypothetical protein
VTLWLIGAAMFLGGGWVCIQKHVDPVRSRGRLGGGGNLAGKIVSVIRPPGRHRVLVRDNYQTGRVILDWVARLFL